MTSEIPEADRQEQQQPVAPDEPAGGPITAVPDGTAEADEADRLDQAITVPIDDDDQPVGDDLRD